MARRARGNEADLRRTLERIDGRGYKAYKDIEGAWEIPARDGPPFTLIVDHVQGDPFAAPSRLRVRVPHPHAQLPGELYQNRVREIAFRDYLTRVFGRAARQESSRTGSGKGGAIAIAPCGQEILERTSVLIDRECFEARFTVGLPAAGRKVLGRAAAGILCDSVPKIVARSLSGATLDRRAATEHVEVAEDAEAIRSALKASDLVAFVADESVLPRRSGVDDRPLPERVVPFTSPGSLRVTLPCPNLGTVTGMGVRKGITLIVGGGYHGKSTLLSALERGVYNHVPGDGREYVVADESAVKIRAEDGRSVIGVDISPFITDLPGGTDTKRFSSPNASGSTSQAANIVEAVEAGARTLLVDEDTAATNFMIRDHRMQELIAKDREPITPFVDKVRRLYDDLGVSTVLVMGGSGDYFDVADTVVAMDHFRPYDVTEQAKGIAERYERERADESGGTFGEIRSRCPQPEGIDPSKGKKPVKTQARDLEELAFGTEEIDLRSVSQIVDTAQVRAVASALVHAKERHIDGRLTMSELLDRIEHELDKGGLDAVARGAPGDIARFRRHELAAALNRLRTLRVS